ncbi:hypothetical protein BDV26DRAFT_294760 [Aspergillus bertholletiae]|uniref:Fungal-type protein kinase domain-containing protein n=1 Tax=Aspergillus bertholletiae TaxID=1226010 RepID=A0A5N7B1A0_9EURO|nr:hypothetical protein BDV26DRAFT_294760 [Aspergillus bertholletiae]
MTFGDAQGANALGLPPGEMVIPDIIIHSPTGEVRFVGEIKTSWTTDLGNLWSREERRFLAQVIRYMDVYGTLYGCASTYEQTVFLKRTGPRSFQVSPVIQHGTPSQANPIKTSLRECFFAIATHVMEDQNWSYGGARVGPTLVSDIIFLEAEYSFSVNDNLYRQSQ